MNFLTPVENPHDDFTLNLEDRLLIMGSCFAEHIGQKLSENKFRCETNPFGVLYNPESIRLALNVIADLAEGKPYPTQYFFQSEGMWNSWLHSTLFSAPQKEECHARIKEPLERIVPEFKNTYALILTLGTNVYYRLRKGGLTVSNCHRQPGNLFEEKRLGVREITESYTALLERLFSMNPSLRVLFTVSPYRYRKYGMHESQLSKATLLLAVDELTKHFPDRCFYFPAYEILLDELRDYRFYAEDMLHPSPQAVNYVIERFGKYAFDASTQVFLKEWSGIPQALAHRPLHPESDEYHTFLENLRSKIVGLNKKYPNLAFQKELLEIERLLTN